MVKLFLISGILAKKSAIMQSSKGFKFLEAIFNSDDGDRFSVLFYGDNAVKFSKVAKAGDYFVINGQLNGKKNSTENKFKNTFLIAKTFENVTVQVQSKPAVTQVVKPSKQVSETDVNMTTTPVATKANNSEENTEATNNVTGQVQETQKTSGELNKDFQNTPSGSSNETNSSNSNHGQSNQGKQVSKQSGDTSNDPSVREQFDQTISEAKYIANQQSEDLKNNSMKGKISNQDGKLDNNSNLDQSATNESSNSTDSGLKTISNDDQDNDDFNFGGNDSDFDFFEGGK